MPLQFQCHAQIHNRLCERVKKISIFFGDHRSEGIPVIPLYLNFSERCEFCGCHSNAVFVMLAVSNINPSECPSEGCDLWLNIPEALNLLVTPMPSTGLTLQ